MISISIIAISILLLFSFSTTYNSEWERIALKSFSKGKFGGTSVSRVVGTTISSPRIINNPWASMRIQWPSRLLHVCIYPNEAEDVLLIGYM